jgi:arsenate reductase
MADFTIYHNPRCSKSRNTLALLEEHGVSPRVVLYLDTPPDAALIRQLLAKLGCSAAQLVRRGEADYKACGLGAASSEEEIIEAMTSHPKLIERPIVVAGERAVVGRPPENVLGLLS